MITFIVCAQDDEIQIGSIVLWYGTASSVPTGYQICNGSGGAVTLTGKFVHGASADGDIGATGGATSHSHTGAGNTQTDIYNHSHGYSVTFTSGGTTGTSVSSPAQSVASSGHTHSSSSGMSGDASHSHTISSSTYASSSSLPTYKRLYYIQRVS